MATRTVRNLRDQLDLDETGKTAGQAIVVAGDGTTYELDTVSGGGGSTTGITRSISQVAHGLAVGNAVRFNGTAYVKAQADSATNAEIVGMVSAVASANAFTLETAGLVTGLSGLTAGEVYFLSPSVAGALTATEPTTVGQVSKPLLVADSTTSGYLFNFRGALVGAQSTPVQAAFPVGDAASVPSATFVDLEWGFRNDFGPTNDVLDLTDPTLPVILQTGLHHFTTEFLYISTTPVPGKVFTAFLFMDYNGFYDGLEHSISLDSIDPLKYPKVVLSASIYLEAGMVIEAFVRQNTGGPISCSLWAWVVRS